MSLRGKVVQETDTEPEGGGSPYKYMALKLEEPICFKNDPDTKIEVVALKVAKKWIGRDAVVTGSMEGGLMWFINVTSVAPMTGIVHADPLTTEEKEQGCGGYAALETAQMVLHMENIAHATADDLINKSSRKVKAAAQKAFAYCMKVGPEKVTPHHYCNDLSKTWDDGHYKCKMRGTYGVAK